MRFAAVAQLLFLRMGATAARRDLNLGELGRLYELIRELAEAEPTDRIRPGLPLKFTARVAKLADAADLGSLRKEPETRAMR